MATLISAGLAGVLLVLYAYAIGIVCKAPESQPNEGTETVLSSVGGLVSSVVVGALAITPPGGNPSEVIFLLSSGQRPQAGVLLTNILVWSYFVIWLLCGAALWHSWLHLETGKVASSALKSAAKAWLGLMIAAGFAYFGLKPTG